MIIPEKLKPGSHIRVISPATSLSYISEESRAIADQHLSDMGLRVSFSQHAEENDRFNSSRISSRLSDLHDAFADESVDAILTTLGGYNSNQLLDYLDYELIRQNPKIFCGYSDITALSMAIFAKTGLVTYSGPHYSTFGMQKGLSYTIEYFKKCLFNDVSYEIHPSLTWSDDPWYANQSDRAFVESEGYSILNEGRSEGTLIGGNLSTIVLLHGTQYLPDLRDSILLIEDDCEASAPIFDRYLQALTQQTNFDKVRAILIGRFQRNSEIDAATLDYIVKTKKLPRHVPVVAHASFGHTTPQFTFPIGGTGKLTAQNGQVNFQILKH